VEVKDGRLRDFRYKLLPIFSDLIAPDREMAAHIEKVRAPYRKQLELLDDRVGSRSTLITSQLPVNAWHTWLDDPTLADAILDRIVHAAHRIALKGNKSMRDPEAEK
jgi:DNA-binding transcriptional MocR family regulator